MIDLIYGLCTITAFLCAWLLLKAYSQSRYRVLLWGGLCFVGLTLNNILVIVDKVLTPPEIDLTTLRYVAALSAMVILLYGLIWDTE